MSKDSMVDLSRSEVRALQALLGPVREAEGTLVKAARVIGVGDSAVGEILRCTGVMSLGPRTLDAMEKYFRASRADLLSGRAARARAAAATTPAKNSPLELCNDLPDTSEGAR